MSETWLPVEGYEGAYEVSDLGRVRSLDRVILRRNRWGMCEQRLTGQLLKHEINKQGYHRVVLNDEGVARKYSVHRLVAEAFIGPRPEGLQVCHEDDDKDNNRASNLRFDTASANIRDAVRNGVQAQARKTHCPNGHCYDEANTYRCKRGRHCRTCHRDAERVRKASLRAA